MKEVHIIPIVVWNITAVQ